MLPSHFYFGDEFDIQILKDETSFGRFVEPSKWSPIICIRSLLTVCIPVKKKKWNRLPITGKCFQIQRVLCRKMNEFNKFHKIHLNSFVVPGAISILFQCVKKNIPAFPEIPETCTFFLLEMGIDMVNTSHWNLLEFSIFKIILSFFS